MGTEDLGKKLSQVMDAVPVCEGLIYAKTDGKVIMGHTLMDSDHASLAKIASNLFKMDVSAAERGISTEFSIGLEKGVLITVKNKDELVIGLLGEDGRGSVGLLMRQLKNIMSSE